MTKEEYVDFANALMNNYTIDFDKLPEFCDMSISILSALESADLISRKDLKARYRERFMNSLIDKDRNIDFSEYAETLCKQFNEFMDSIPCAVSEKEKKTDTERIKQILSELAQYNADMLKAFNAGKELAEREKREWIPVSSVEEMPKECLWVTHKGADYAYVELIGWDSERECRTEDGGFWCDSNRLKDVVAYMLYSEPKPYKAESE